MKKDIDLMNPFEDDDEFKDEEMNGNDLSDNAIGLSFYERTMQAKKRKKSKLKPVVVRSKNGFVLKSVAYVSKIMNQRFPDRRIGIGMAHASIGHTQIATCLMNYIDAIISQRPEFEKGYFVGVEAPLKRNGEGKVPDVLLYRRGKVADKRCKDKVKSVLVPYIIVEVEHSRNIENAKKKSRGYVRQYRQVNPNIETYVFDYFKRKWYSFGRTVIKSKPSYSPMLGVDLNDAINWDKVDIESYPEF